MIDDNMHWKDNVLYSVFTQRYDETRSSRIYKIETIAVHRRGFGRPNAALKRQ